MNPDDRIAVTLTAQTWNVLLSQVAEGPYRVVAPLIQEIQQQCMRHEQENLLDPGVPRGPRVNGAADQAHAAPDLDH